jgi:hypothetical protein
MEDESDRARRDDRAPVGGAMQNIEHEWPPGRFGIGRREAGAALPHRFRLAASYAESPHFSHAQFTSSRRPLSSSAIRLAPRLLHRMSGARIGRADSGSGQASHFSYGEPEIMLASALESYFHSMKVGLWSEQ